MVPREQGDTAGDRSRILGARFPRFGEIAPVSVVKFPRTIKPPPTVFQALRAQRCGTYATGRAGRLGWDEAVIGARDNAACFALTESSSADRAVRARVLIRRIVDATSISVESTVSDYPPCGISCLPR
jgi:hypothetical protein